MTSFLPNGEVERISRMGAQGMAYGYARVSTAEQTANDSIDGQKTRIMDYYNHRLKPMGVVWGGMHVDPGVSAFKVPFERRPSGAKLLSELKPGDHVIVDRVDRMCRSASNMHKLIQYAQANKLSFHFLDCNLDPTTPMGEMIIGVIAILAQLDSSMKGKRIKESHAWRIRTGNRAMTRQSDTLLGKSLGKCGIIVKQRDDCVDYYINWHEYAAAKFICDNPQAVPYAWRSLHYREAELLGEKYRPCVYGPIKRPVMTIDYAGRLHAQWERYISMLLKALPWEPYPPEDAKQDKSVRFARAILNSNGEVHRWIPAYKPSDPCRWNYKLVPKELVFVTPSKSHSQGLFKGKGNKSGVSRTGTGVRGEGQLQNSDEPGHQGGD